MPTDLEILAEIQYRQLTVSDASSYTELVSLESWIKSRIDSDLCAMSAQDGYLSLATFTERFGLPLFSVYATTPPLHGAVSGGVAEQMWAAVCHYWYCTLSYEERCCQFTMDTGPSHSAPPTLLEALHYQQTICRNYQQMSGRSDSTVPQAVAGMQHLLEDVYQEFLRVKFV